MLERTLIRGWISPHAYRSTVVHTHDVDAAIAELRRVDAIAPALTHTYLRFGIEQWVVGDPSSEVSFILDGDA